MASKTMDRHGAKSGDRGQQFLAGLLSAIMERTRRLTRRRPADLSGAGEARHDAPPIDLCEELLSGRGEASQIALAAEILSRWDRLTTDARRAFLVTLTQDFGAERARLDRAVEAYQINPDAAAIAELYQAAEPRRQELFRRLNLAPYGTASLLRMRVELLSNLGEEPQLAALDRDFVHLFSSWFNRGFLVLRRIDWTTPAHILEKIIRYEAVHAIDNWDDLRRRILPADRTCFAFFHPQLVDEPLIFVEVALTAEIPAAIDRLLSPSDATIIAEEANTAVFYSISNCQKGLRGIPLGDFLIKQVVEELKRELPNLSTFVTLSPVPGFAAWLADERRRSEYLTPLDLDFLTALDRRGWEGETHSLPFQEALLRAVAIYLLRGKGAS